MDTTPPSPTTAPVETWRDMYRLTEHSDTAHTAPSGPSVGFSGDAGSSRARAEGNVPDSGVPASGGAPPESPLRPTPGTAPEALKLPAGEASLAPKGRILDTLETALETPESTQQFGLEKLRVLPGQREIGLPGYHAQVGLFDGLGYAVPDAVHDPDAPPERADPDQLAFVFPLGGVQLGFDEWHRERDDRLRWLAAQYPRGKTRKALRRRAKAGDECGKIVRARVCEHGHVEAKEYVASHCKTRTCPASARANALELRAKLYAAVKRWPGKRKRQEWFFHTVTVRRPEWTTIERLRIDRRRAFAGWKAGWALIRKICGGKRAQVHLEVAPGGMVHLHALAHHRYIRPEQLALIRDAVLNAIGGGTTQYRVDRIGSGKGKKGGIKEVAKYLCKGVAMNNSAAYQTHPMLAAMIEAAYINRPMARQYGDWKGLHVPDHEDEHEWHCPVCGTDKFSWSYYDKNTGQTVEVPTERDTS